MIRACALASLLLMLNACVGDILNTEPEVRGLAGAAPLQTLTYPSQEAAVTLRPGGQLKVVLAAAPTTGFVWQVDPEATPQVTLLSEAYAAHPLPADYVGGGGDKTYVFQATDVLGQTQLVFSQQRPWNNELAERVTITVRIVPDPNP